MTLRRCNLLTVARIASELSKKYNIPRTKLFQRFLCIIPSQQRNRIGSKASTFQKFPLKMASTSTLKEEPTKTNRLALEKSPYLLQHAANPVNWFPWCDEALEKAKNEGKLIFLSVGYSTCHWCHVMEKESFKNEEIAAIMNEHFVNVKVDREERPDIDRIYMTFVQAMTGHGGWPMSVFLTPDLKPVVGGTYFPPEDTFRQPGFKTILTNISEKWKHMKAKIVESGSVNLETLQSISDFPHSSKSQELPSIECAAMCVQQLTSEFESKFGGFSEAPKFPQPVNLNFLFLMHARKPDEEIAKHCLHMCTYTLTKISFGGIHDHVGQGFSRYSTDDEWHVPHFEKMLYDQAQLMQSYADAYIATKEPLFAEMIDDIATYVSRDLRHKEGGFYSAEDADSYPTHGAPSKKEGAFYVWSLEEIKSLLDKEISNREDIKYYTIFCYHFNIKDTGNVKRYQDPHGELTGKNVLIMYDGIEKTAREFNLGVEETRVILKESCSILYEARSRRPRPHLDDKIITAWNGLMISGFARAGSVLNNKQYVEYAVDAAKFIENYLFDEQKNILLRSCYRGDNDTITQTSVPIAGFLDDYAFLVKGLLDLYEASFEERWLELAERFQDIQDRLFGDEKNGGYFFTTSDDPTVMLRMKEAHDGVEPSGNSVSAENLLRLSSYLNRADLMSKSEALLKSFKHALSKRPITLPHMVYALTKFYSGPTEVFVAGKRGSEDTEQLLREINQRPIVHRMAFLVDEDEPSGFLSEKHENLKNMKPVHGKAAAYVCRNHSCSLPVTCPTELATLLESSL